MPKPRKIDQQHIIEPTEAAVAFERLKPQFMKLPASELAQVNLDIPSATALVRGIAPRLQSYREQILKKLPEHPIEYLDNLVDYALAAWQGFILNLPPLPSEELPGLLEQAKTHRAYVFDAAEGLSKGRLLSAQAIAEIAEGSSQLDTATDLSQLCVLLTAVWPQIHNKTYLTLEDVQRAGELGGKLHAALAERAHAKPTAETAEWRTRSFTLFVNVYDEDRRAFTYLRWREGDVDEIAPSLYANGGGPRKRADGKTSGAASTQGTSGTTGTTTGGTGPSAPAAGQGQGAANPNQAAGRGGAPFTRDPNSGNGQ